MSYVYPRSTVKPEPEEIATDDEVAELLIAFREDGNTEDEALGRVIAVSGSVKQARRVQSEVNEERNALKAVPLDAEAKYLAAISAKTKYIDPAEWVARQKAIAPLKAVVVEAVVKG